MFWITSIVYAALLAVFVLFGSGERQPFDTLINENAHVEEDCNKNHRKP